MISFIDICIIVAYFLILIVIGYRHRQEGIKRPNLKWWAIGSNMWATNIVPSMMIASAGIAYSTGIVTANFSLLSVVFIFVLVFVFASKYLKSESQTLPQYLGMRYGERIRKLYAFYSLLITLVSWLSLQLFAGGLFFKQMFGIPILTSAAILLLFSMVFSVLGGLRGIAYTSVFQNILLIFGPVCMLFYGIKAVGGLNELVEHTPDHYWQLCQTTGGYPWYAFLLGYPVLGIWFWCADQTMVQSIFGAKDLKSAQLGGNLIGWLKMLDLPLFILPGIICFVLFPNLANSDEAFYVMLTNLIPNGMSGIITAALLAALISTIEPALNSFSSVFVLDVWGLNYTAPQQKIKIGKILSNIIAAVLSLCMVFLITHIKGLNLFDVFQSILSFLAPPICALFLLTFLWRGTSRVAVIFSLTGGIALSLLTGTLYLWIFTASEHDFWPHYLVVSFFLTLLIILIMIVLSLLFPDKLELVDSQLPIIENNVIRRSVMVSWSLLLLALIVGYIILK